MSECQKISFSIFIYRIFSIFSQVPVGEISVFIATSSPQRKAAIEATEWLINSLKERVPIWKKVFLEINFNKKFKQKHLTKLAIVSSC